MFPQIHFNLAGITFDRLYQYLVPLIPGAVLVGGLIIVHPELVSSLMMVCGANPYVRLGVLTLAAYVMGWVVFGASAVITGLATGVVTLLLDRFVYRKRIWLRSNLELSKCTNWRKVAGKVLGPELTPVPPPPASESLNERIASFSKDLEKAQQYDAEWKEWYDVLQDYLLRDVPRITSDTISFVLALEATGWVIVWLSVASPHATHWAFYAVAWLFILLGVLTPAGAATNYLNSDRLTYWDFTARLLAEVHAREVRKSSPVAISPVEEKKS